MPEDDLFYNDLIQVSLVPAGRIIYKYIVTCGYLSHCVESEVESTARSTVAIAVLAKSHIPACSAKYPKISGWS